MKHLTTRLVILLMLALMVITGAFDYFRLVRERDRLIEQTRQDTRIFAETLALAVSRNVRRGRTTEELKELLDEILARPGLLWLAIYDPSGQMVAASVRVDATVPPADNAIHETLRTRAASSTTLRGKGGEGSLTLRALVQGEESGGGAILRHIQPVRWPDRRTAALELLQSLAGVEHEFAASIRERVLARLAVLVFFVLSIVAVTRWSIALPIRALIRGARAVGGGDLSQRITVRRPDEVGQLADEFNRMAENLESAHRALVVQSEERLRLELEVQQAQKLAAVGMLAAEVAHEVGTPLNIISGRAEVLDRTLAPDHSGRRHLEVILRQTERITGIIRALLDYTRPRRPALHEEALPPLLARVSDLAAGRDRAKRVRIRLDLPVALPRVLADADQIQQLFLNVLANAVDASPPGGTIRVTEGPDPVLPSEGRAGIVRGQATRPCLAIHVVDQGPGLSADDLTRVFEPFFSTKKRGHGTGLGLPIVEEIARAHDGDVEMLSIPGTGTEVIVRLPLAGGEANDSAPSKSPAAGEHGR